MPNLTPTIVSSISGSITLDVNIKFSCYIAQLGLHATVKAERLFNLLSQSFCGIGSQKDRTSSKEKRKTAAFMLENTSTIPTI